jgi:TIR domain
VKAPALAGEAPVFLCHARPDLPFVRPLAAYLRAHRLRAWLDVDDLPPGEDWKSAIETLLAGPSRCIACISSHSARSRWTSFELDLAIRHGVTITPLLTCVGAQQALPAALRQLPAIDVSHLPAEQGAFVAARRLASDTGERPVDTTAFVARAIHERWRTALRAAGQTNKWKTVGQNELDGPPHRLRGDAAEIDLLQLSFDQLPPSLAQETSHAAADAATILRSHATAGIEQMARRVHAGWVARNGRVAAKELTGPYEHLPEEEKEKDRLIVRTAALALGLAVPG